MCAVQGTLKLNKSMYMHVSVCTPACMCVGVGVWVCVCVCKVSYKSKPLSEAVCYLNKDIKYPSYMRNVCLILREVFG